MQYPTILADALCVRQFSIVANARGRFTAGSVQTDEFGHAWLVSCLPGLSCAISILGIGRHFDPAARQHWSAEHSARLRSVSDMTQEQRVAELRRTASEIRFGPLSERLVWLIHSEVLRCRRSSVRIPITVVRATLWPTESAPQHWRSDLDQLLQSLSRLHIGDPIDDEGHCEFGDRSSLLTHFRIDRRGEHRTCPASCLQHGHAPHEHLLVSIGRGFLGCLESLADEDSQTGIRRYCFAGPDDDKDVRKAKDGRLKAVGKTGRLMTMYLPAKLGTPAAVGLLSPRQHRLLQVIFRELTRKQKKHRSQTGEPDEFAGPSVRGSKPRRSGQRVPMLRCPYLTEGVTYCGFNGNRTRRGQGYKLSTWVDRTDSGDAAELLSDLRGLSELLGLIVVGLNPKTSAWLTPDDLEMLQRSRPRLAAEIHLRIYVEGGYLDRWNAYFGWAATSSPADAVTPAAEADHLLQQHRVTRSRAAAALGIDPSAFSKMLNGQRSFPMDHLIRLRQLVATTAFH